MQSDDYDGQYQKQTEISIASIKFEGEFDWDSFLENKQ